MHAIRCWPPSKQRAVQAAHLQESRHGAALAAFWRQAAGAVRRELRPARITAARVITNRLCKRLHTRSTSSQDAAAALGGAHLGHVHLAQAGRRNRLRLKLLKQLRQQGGGPDHPRW